MSREIKVPAAGESVSVAVISAWHRKSGDAVKQGDLLVTLDTDKVSQELTADAAGVLKITVPEGTEVSIGAVIGMLEEGAAAPAAVEAPAPAPAPPAPKVEAAAPVPAVAAPAAVSAAPKIDLTVLPAPEKAPAQAPAVSEDGRVTRKRMTPLRRKIATHLVNAQHTAAILTTFNEVDMSEIMSLRKVLQDAFVARHGVKLGFMSFFIKAVVEALKSVPQVNARIEGDDLVQHHYYDIGVAVGTEKGLVVPVVRDADQKTFGQLEKDLAETAKKARDGKIALEDLQGGVFTISNGGIYGSLLSTPILNPPQSAILGMHAIQERPVARDGQVVIRPMMYLALSYDHRLVDGKEAVTFLIRIKECLEQPSRLLLGA